MWAHALHLCPTLLGLDPHQQHHLESVEGRAGSNKMVRMVQHREQHLPLLTAPRSAVATLWVLDKEERKQVRVRRCAVGRHKTEDER